jgi:hypothetical protein
MSIKKADLRRLWDQGEGMKKPTPFGQQILDTIMARVEEACGHGFIGWSIGKTTAVVHELDLKARNKWLSERHGGLVQKLMTDPRSSAR